VETSSVEKSWHSNVSSSVVDDGTLRIDTAWSVYRARHREVDAADSRRCLRERHLRGRPEARVMPANLQPSASPSSGFLRKNAEADGSNHPARYHPQGKLYRNLALFTANTILHDPSGSTLTHRQWTGSVTGST
jgi:hypothetical protein